MHRPLSELVDEKRALASVADRYPLARLWVWRAVWAMCLGASIPSTPTA